MKYFEDLVKLVEFVYIGHTLQPLALFGFKGWPHPPIKVFKASLKASGGSNQSV